MVSVFRDDQAIRRLAGGWLLLALLALALSTACAVLLVAARAPLPGGFAAVAGLFRSALVLHVSLAVIVWFLACAGGLWTLAAGGSAGFWRWSALALAGSGMAAMVASLFQRGAAPVLANYVPVLDSPLFLAGLSLFLGGVVLCGATSVAGIARRLKRGRFELWHAGAALSIAAAAVALGVLLAALGQGGLPHDPAGFEALAWGPGHALQFVHVLLLMSVWTVLGERALDRSIASRGWLIGLLLLAALPVLAAPLIHVFHPLGSAGFRLAYTQLMAWACWPAAVTLAAGLLWQMARAGCAAWSRPESVPLLLSILLYLLGCVFGASIRGESTMVPAHYHGTVGAVTLAYMALGYRLLPAFGLTAGTGWLVRRQPLLYGIGLLTLAAALAWSGWLGVPRKTLHVDVLVQYPAYFAAMGLAGLGGLLAVAGAALFVLNIGRSIRGGWRTQPWTARWPALGATLFMSLTLGLLMAYAPPGGLAGPVSAADDAAGHAKQRRKQEIDRRFAEGVALLSNSRFEEAAAEMHRVLELAPQMPEAHVNMGFAMIGLKRYKVARDFFEAAIDLRTGQTNAYYGLALALEGMDDVPGALGAMRTYVHRNKQADDVHLRKANAAIWEWEEALAKSRQAGAADHRVASVQNEKAAIRYPIREKKIN